MSATRLLVLGAVRIFQPVHGYLVRRELLTWGVESWASLNPGSIYGGLRTLTREGHLSESAPESTGKRPDRTTYELTMDGENAYQGLLRQALWQPDAKDPSLLLAGLCFMPSLRRDETIEALTARATNLELQVAALDRSAEHLAEAGTVPAHAMENFAVTRAWAIGELGWARAALERLHGGYYIFRGEPGAMDGPVDGRWRGPLEKPA